MYAKTLSTLAVLAIAAQAATERQPYKPRVMKMSVHDLFGVARREDDPGYQPSESVCTGAGNTCAEVCGTGYETCASKDETTHCFDKANGQVCCPDNTGNSCDNGFYCSQSEKKKETWCCPNELSLSECAARFNVDGALVAEGPIPNATPSSPPLVSMTNAPTPPRINDGPEEVFTVYVIDKVTQCPSSTLPTPTKFPPFNHTTPTIRPTGSHTPTSTPTQVPVSGAMNAAAGPMAALVMVAAAFAVLL